MPLVERIIKSEMHGEARWMEPDFASRGCVEPLRVWVEGGLPLGWDDLRLTSQPWPGLREGQPIATLRPMDKAIAIVPNARADSDPLNMPPWMMCGNVLEADETVSIFNVPGAGSVYEEHRDPALVWRPSETPDELVVQGMRVKDHGIIKGAEWIFYHHDPRGANIWGSLLMASRLSDVSYGLVSPVWSGAQLRR